MRKNGDLRREARQLVAGKWFWRILWVTMLLNLVSYLANAIVVAVYAHMGINEWTQLVQKKIEAVQQGLEYTLPSTAAWLDLAGASLFQFFIAYIFGSIAAFGIARLVLKAAAHWEGDDWMKGTFGGFGRPLELAWLLFLLNVRVCLWTIVLWLPAVLVFSRLLGSTLLACVCAAPFALPGVIAIYRYRQAWFLKAEDPSLSASACLRASAAMMKGFKWKAFCFDMGYILWAFVGVFVLAIVAMLAGPLKGAVPLVADLISVVSVFAVCGYFVWLTVCLIVGRAVFYRDQKKPAESAEAEPAELT